MARTKAKKASKQTALTGSGFWPMLSKPTIAIGKHASVPGKYWNGCPAADKEKRFMCIVVEFTAMHDFGDGVKGAGFKLRLSCDVTGSPCDAQREILMNGI